MMLQVRRWLPQRPLVLVADGGYAVLTLLDRCVRLRAPVTMVTRLRAWTPLFMSRHQKGSLDKGDAHARKESACPCCSRCWRTKGLSGLPSR